MKNYQKILFPCAAALVLSLSAFVSVDTTVPLNSLAEQSSNDLSRLSVKGADVVSTSVTFNSTRTQLQVSTSSTVSFAESNVVSTFAETETVDVDSIIESYK
jgi:hypothetical protein